MARKRTNTVPNFDQFIVPTVQALLNLGGSGNIEEINNQVYDIYEFNDGVLEIPHGDKGSISEVDYRLAWSRTYLKKFGVLENSSRGIWSLIDPDIDISILDSNEIVRAVREQKNKDKRVKELNLEIKNANNDIDSFEEWKEKLLSILYTVSPQSFERLAQRILRESGFSQVEVTGKAGDGGIDGKGIIRVGGLLSFHIIFQCKRYKGSISPRQIRDFRGAMQGRADKGLFITTGTFTKEALREATRDGAPPIDLIDGELLCEKLKELKLGVETTLIEHITINSNWYEKL